MKEWKGHEHEELITWALNFCIKRLAENIDDKDKRNYTVLKYRIELGPGDQIWKDGTGYRGIKWLREAMQLDDRFKHY